MKESRGSFLFELTSKNEAVSYDALKEYFDAMYFAN